MVQKRGDRIDIIDHCERFTATNHFSYCYHPIRAIDFSDGGIPVFILSTVITVILIFFPREVPTVEEAVDVRVIRFSTFQWFGG